MKVSIGQDSHRFDLLEQEKKCVLGGVVFDGAPALSANSDGDVVLHAVTNAISGITGRNILGRVADEMCRAGITDSSEYLSVALEDLRRQGCQIHHLSISIECLKPKITPQLEAMRASLASLLGVRGDQIGITATTGEHLTGAGSGCGIAVLCILTVKEESDET